MLLSSPLLVLLKVFLQNLSFGFAKEFDHRSNERKQAGKSTPHDTFKKTLYRQVSELGCCLFSAPLTGFVVGVSDREACVS